MTRRLACLALLATTLFANGDALAGPRAPTQATKLAPEYTRTVANRLRKVASLTPRQRAARFRKLAGIQVKAMSFLKEKVVHARGLFAHEDTFLIAGYGSAVNPKLDAIFAQPGSRSVVVFTRVAANKHLFVDCVVDTSNTNQFEVLTLLAEDVGHAGSGDFDFGDFKAQMILTAELNHVTFVIPKSDEVEEVAFVIGAPTAKLFLNRCELSEVS